MGVKSRFYEKLSDDVVRCTICPRMCVMTSGERGFCGTKENSGGEIISLTYGQISAVAVDPIEKKPLAHFYPGSLAFSISSVGCSFTCPWCQNWHLSAAKPGELPIRMMSPQEVVKTSKEKRCTSIAYTYNEPLINLDFVEDVSRSASKHDVKNVLVTNGYISIPALSRVVDVIDAANVDWKAFNEDFYRNYCRADLHSVLDSTVELKKQGVHIEVTLLVIPETNDSQEEMKRMARFIVEKLGPDTPLHLSRFFPHYKFTHVPPTPFETLIEARKTALKEGIRFVYIGNAPLTGYENTFCPSCGKPVIERVGYNITGWNLEEDNTCKFCGEKIPIIGKHESHSRLFPF